MLLVKVFVQQSFNCEMSDFWFPTSLQVVRNYVRERWILWVVYESCFRCGEKVKHGEHGFFPRSHYMTKKFILQKKCIVDRRLSLWPLRHTTPSQLASRCWLHTYYVMRTSLPSHIMRRGINHHYIPLVATTLLPTFMGPSILLFIGGQPRDMNLGLTCATPANRLCS